MSVDDNLPMESFESLVKTGRCPDGSILTTALEFDRMSDQVVSHLKICPSCQELQMRLDKFDCASTGDLTDVHVLTDSERVSLLRAIGVSETDNDSYNEHVHRKVEKFLAFRRQMPYSKQLLAAAAILMVGVLGVGGIGVYRLLQQPEPAPSTSDLEGARQGATDGEISGTRESTPVLTPSTSGVVNTKASLDEQPKKDSEKVEASKANPSYSSLNSSSANTLLARDESHRNAAQSEVASSARKSVETKETSSLVGSPTRRLVIPAGETVLVNLEHEAPTFTDSSEFTGTVLSDSGTSTIIEASAKLTGIMWRSSGKTFFKLERLGLRSGTLRVSRGGRGISQNLADERRLRIKLTEETVFGN